jgi:hypothetical protein
VRKNSMVKFSTLCAKHTTATGGLRRLALGV